MSVKPVKLDFKVVEPSVKKNKCDMILMHGISGTKEAYDDIATDLANQTGRKVYMLDARNHGNSEHSDDITFKAMTADVLNFMDQQKIKSASFMGHSMGGRLSLVLALAHAERVESIIVEDMTPKALPRSVVAGMAEIMNLFDESVKTVSPDADIETATTTIFEYVFKNKPKEALLNAKMPEDCKSIYLPLVKKDGKYAWKTNFRVIRKEILGSMNYCENLQGHYNGPALFLYGTLSEHNIDKDEDFILKMIPNAQFYGLPTSHMVHKEAPKEYVEAVVKFLA